jgi:hypothetical protein
MIQTADISIVTNPTLNGVTYSSLVGVAGPQASIANRYTAIRWINTSLNSSFYYKINQETDASHIGLWAVLPGIDSILLSGTVSGSVYTYKLDTFLQNNPDFLINSANGDTGFVLLKQQVIRKCSGTNSSTTVYAEWTCTDCSPNPQSNSASLNVTVQVNNIIPQLSYTVSPSALSCNTTQTFEYRIRIANSTVQWLDSIIIPVDTGYFAIDEFYLQHDADTLHILPTQYGINSNGTTNKIHLKLQNLPVAPPGMFSGVSGLSGTINYLFNDTLFAVLKLHFKCNGYNQA